MNLITLDIHSKSSILPEMATEGLVILLDKPVGWTSFDVVNKTRYILRKRLNLKKLKVGHAGTLDPMASGLLIICTGKFTTHLQSFQDLGKTYSGTFVLGGVTASYDRETPVENIRPWEHISEVLIEEKRLKFLGDIGQIPPIFSAIKVDGKRAYMQARKGQEIVMQGRTISIFDFQLAAGNLPEIKFSITCSKGTYIRSIAHDFGQELGCGAYLGSLQRDKIGTYVLENALTLDQLADWATNSPLPVLREE